MTGTYPLSTAVPVPGWDSRPGTAVIAQTGTLPTRVAEFLGLGDAGPVGQVVAALVVAAFVCPFVNLVLTALIVGLLAV